MKSRDESPRGSPEHKLYRTLFESAPDAVLVIGSSGMIFAANPQAERLFGYPAHELEGEAIENHEQLQRDAHFLQKPFRKADLAQEVRLALGSDKSEPRN